APVFLQVPQKGPHAGSTKREPKPRLGLGQTSDSFGPIDFAEGVEVFKVVGQIGAGRVNLRFVRIGHYPGYQLGMLSEQLLDIRFVPEFRMNLGPVVRRADES